jgi:hypothetical protein
MIDLTSIEAPARGVENSGVLASLSFLGCLAADRFSEFSHLIKSQFYMPTNVQNIFITKLFEPWIIYKDVCSIANFCQIGSRYAMFLTNIYGNITAKQKISPLCEKLSNVTFNLYNVKAQKWVSHRVNMESRIGSNRASLVWIRCSNAGSGARVFDATPGQNPSARSLPYQSDLD